MPKPRPGKPLTERARDARRRAELARVWREGYLAGLTDVPKIQRGAGEPVTVNPYDSPDEGETP